MATIGATNKLSSVTANTVLNGRTLRAHFLVGTLFDPNNPLKLILLEANTNVTTLQFPTITGRSYSVQGSTDYINWTTASFNLSTEATGSPSRAYYYAPGISTIQLNVVPPPPGTAKQFYRVIVQ